MAEFTVNPMRLDPYKGRASRTPLGGAAAGGRAARRWNHTDDLPLPSLSGCRLQQILALGRPVRARGHTRRPDRGRSRRPHLHRFEARLGDAPGFRPCVRSLLRQRGPVASFEPRAARETGRTDVVTSSLRHCVLRRGRVRRLLEGGLRDGFERHRRRLDQPLE